MGSYSRNRYATESASFPKSESSAPGSYAYATFAELPASGSTPGNTAFIVATNRLYIWSGVGWYLIATVTNASPTAISGVAGSYTLANDGSATTITAVSTDPEGFTLTWSYVVSTGSLGSTATVAQADNVFTITPSADAANAGTFSLTFRVSDGLNGVVAAVSAFTLQFTVLNSKYTTLSAKATATGSNLTFADASPLNQTVTSTAGYASTFSPHRSGEYSGSFDGTGDYLSIPTSADFALGTGAFTVEFWVYQHEVKNYTIYFDYRPDGSEPTLYLYQLATGVFDLHINGTSRNFTPPSMLNKWSHIAIARSGTTTKLFVDGVQFLNFTDNTNYVQGSTFYISRYWQSDTYNLNGYMRDFRWVKGTAVYTSAFTPPTEPLTAITNTKLLIGGSLPYFKDQSTSNHTITSGGNAAMEPISLFDSGLPYSEASHGASVYFDGATGNSLTVPHNSGFDMTGDYVVEFWFNILSTGSNQILFDKTGGGVSLQLPWVSNSNKKIALYLTDASGNVIINVSGIGPVVMDNGWHHFSFVRDNSAGTYVSYIDGAVINTTTSAANSGGTGTFRLGGPGGSSTTVTKGHMSDIKFLTSIPSDRNAPFTLPASPSTFASMYPAMAIGVANSGASAYTLSGAVTGNNTTVNMAIGQTVNFTVNASGHPFYIRVSNAGANVSTPAATGQGATSGVVSWTPNAAGTYYYQCGNHNAMIGTIVVTAGIKFLLNPETSISDLSQRNTLKCFGGATTSTSVVKYTGTKSISIPSAGSYVRLVDPADSWIYPAAASNYTIELWLNLTNVSNGTYQEFLTCGIGFQWYVDSSGDLRIALSANNSGSYVWHPSPMHRLVSNTRHHLALVRQGLNYTVYVDGVSKGSTSNAADTNTGTNVLEIGAYAGGQYTSIGYYQDVRITKGLARYTGNFTPPTSESQG